MTKPKRKADSATAEPAKPARRARREAKPQTTKERLSAAIKGVRVQLRKDAGLSGDADRVPQLTWLLFLKSLDDFDHEREALYGDRHEPLIEAPYRWRDWASNPDQTKRPTGGDLIAFVNGDLIPYLGKLAGSSARDLRSIVGKIFAENPSRIRSGTILREVVDRLSKIDFTSSEDTYTVSHFYETMLREMRDAAGDSGEFYTPRPVVKFIVNRLAPRLGEHVLDPACGTCGFLVEAYEQLKELARTPEQQRQLWDSIAGVEKKPMPYLLGVMNLMLHGIEEPNVVESNALSQNIQHFRDEDRVDVIATNPPFGGEEERGVLINFPTDMRTPETALLFFQHVMARLKRPGGRCGIVLPHGFLFGTGVAAEVKKKLLNDFNLHTIVRLPNGVFAPYTPIPTNLLFFEACPPDAEKPCTTEVWYYELPVPDGRRGYTKTKPLQFDEFGDCVEWWDQREESERAWRVPAQEFFSNGFNLDVKNPRGGTGIQHLPPRQLIERIVDKELRMHRVVNGIDELVKEEDTLAHTCEWIPMSEAAPLVRRPVQVELAATYREIGIRSFGKGSFHKPLLKGAELGSKRVFEIHEGDLLFNIVFAWEGAVAVAKSQDDGFVGSHRFLTCVTNPSVVSPYYLWFYFMTEPGLRKLGEASPGGAGRNRTLGLKALSRVRVPIPPLETQKWFERLWTQIELLKSIRSERSVELDALLPSILNKAFGAERS